MEFNRELLFFFSALGAFNGLVLSFYFLFFTKTKHISSQFLGAFLLFMSIRIGKSVFYYFNRDLSIHFLQFGLTACFFIGPFLYFYVTSIMKPKSKISKTWKYHIFPLLIFALIVGFIYPFKNNIQLWRPYFIKTIYFEWFVYTVFSGFVLKNVFIKLFDAKTKLTSIEVWLLTIYIGNTVILFAYIFTNFTYYIVGALTFSFLFYLLILFLFFNQKKQNILFDNNKKYVDKKIDTLEANQLLEKLIKIMDEEKLYQNPNLKSSDVAKRMQVSTHQLSQLLNDNLHKNFATFVNELRINEAKEQLISDSNYTLEAIGYECGFNSKSTFFTTFKKMVGKTPSQFKSSNL